MPSFDKFLKDNLWAADALLAEPVKPPERVQARFEAAFKEMFPDAPAGDDAASAIEPKLLSIQEIRLVILKTLTEGTATGSEIIDRLAELHLEFEVKGDGAIFGILHGMEADSVISTRFEESTATTRYQITEKGSGLLRREESAAFDGLGLSSVWQPR